MSFPYFFLFLIVALAIVLSLTFKSSAGMLTVYVALLIFGIAILVGRWWLMKKRFWK